MQPVLELCKPRPEILAGTFNPEVFTASLSPVIEYYHSGMSGIDTIYTDAELFFREATYPTQGLRTVLSEVFARLAGDLTVPAIHRLETAFGGGKTHTLISCTHLAYRGQELEDVTSHILGPALLPDPGSVAVVGVAGDEIPVHKPKGNALVPYTLWGEIAYQIGGEDLYREVEDDASSYAAPGKTYFEKVFSGRKAVIMLDELAQYSARLEAARSDGASQLAAFLLALHGYARTHSGIAILLTLASSADAFSKQTQRLAELIGAVRGNEVSEDDAIGIGERAVGGVTSVVARDAVQITPVQAGEISSVLAKRLFLSVDREAARKTAVAYLEMYRRNSDSLPEEASSSGYEERMLATYPFHPTLVDFLNRKLADAENFQGTRGVLRVLSLAVRSLWQKNRPVPMIHTCHLDLREERVVNEILGRTGSSDLLFVLNADIGGVDTGTLEGGLSNAEQLDRSKPHPGGHPFHEYTWKTVYLHSLVGRAQGLESRIFGITEPEALLAVAFPGLTPPQVRTALEEITDHAFYLRDEQGKYFASEEPTLNNVLAKIRKTVTGEQIKKLLEAAARKTVTTSNSFHLEHDVSLPEHLPDGKGRPVLGIVALTAGAIDLEAMITTKSLHTPRVQQNLIFLLVPDTVAVEAGGRQGDLFPVQSTKSQEARQRLEFLARQVKAMRILGEKPQNYGVNPSRLKEEDFKERHAKQELALETAVAGRYNSFYYPSQGSYMVRRDLKTGGGEGGAPFLEQIKQILRRDNMLLTSDHTTKSDLVSLSQLFFQRGEVVKLGELRRNFCCLRGWPILETPAALEQIVRAGVQKGIWCAFQMGSDENVLPDEFYHQNSDIPLDADLATGDYGLVTVEGANKRGWGGGSKVDLQKMKKDITYTIARHGAAVFETAAHEVMENVGEIPEKDFQEAVVTLVKEGRLYAYHGSPDQQEKPELISSARAALYVPQQGDVLITPAAAAERGWLGDGERGFSLSGNEGAAKVLPLLRRLGSIYNRGGKSTVSYLDISDMKLPASGSLRISLTNAAPETMKALAEFFETVDNVAEPGETTEVFLEIDDPAADCPLIRELSKE